SQTRLLDPAARPHGEPQDIGVKFDRSLQPIGHDFDVVDSLEHHALRADRFRWRCSPPRLRGEGWGEGPVRPSAAPSKWGPSPFTRKPRCARPPTSPHKRGEVLACALNSFAAN